MIFPDCSAWTKPYFNSSFTYLKFVVNSVDIHTCTKSILKPMFVRIFLFRFCFVLAFLFFSTCWPLFCTFWLKRFGRLSCDERAFWAHVMRRHPEAQVYKSLHIPSSSLSIRHHHDHRCLDKLLQPRNRSSNLDPRSPIPDPQFPIPVKRDNPHNDHHHRDRWEPRKKNI